MLDRASMDVAELRLFLDGEFEVDPEPPGSDDASLELVMYLRLGEIPGITVDAADLSATGDLEVEFIGGTRLTAFGPPGQAPPHATWQLVTR